MSDEQMNELDRILKLWSESQQANLLNISGECMHEEHHYIGFMEEYKFCIKCDAKMEEGEWIKKPIITTNFF